MKENAIDERLLGKELSQKAIKIVHYFAVDTVERILNHIERMDIVSTHALKNSIRSIVHTNASGNQMLVRFFYLYYGECVEQAVGRYYGVDADLSEGTGLKSENVGAPQIEGKNYGAMDGLIKGVPAIRTTSSGKVIHRGDYHRPRPFLRSEIRRNVERVGIRIMKECGELVSVHTMNSLGGLMKESIDELLMPFFGAKTKRTGYSLKEGLNVR